jgi:hypothetical protein
MTDNYDKAEAERIARDLLRTLRDHHMGGVLSVAVPTPGIARALADHLNETPFLKPDDRGTMGAREDDFRRRLGAREAVSAYEQLYVRAEWLSSSAHLLAFHDLMDTGTPTEREKFASRLLGQIRQDLDHFALLLPEGAET